MASNGLVMVGRWYHVWIMLTAMRWLALLFVGSFVAVVACSNDPSAYSCCTVTVSGMTTCVCTNTMGANCTIKSSSATACILSCKGMAMELQGTPQLTCGDAGK